VRNSLDPLYGTRSHRQLYQSLDELFSVLLELAKRAPDARTVLSEIVPVVREYHQRALPGGSEAWEEIRESYLEQERQPLRVMRSAAGWVVLIGLAGTVFGFGSAIPALRNVLTTQDAPSSAQSSEKSEVTSPHRSSDAEKAALGGQRLSKVLDSLGGVFIATFAGVASALLLSFFAQVGLEPAYVRFSREVDLLGARWFVPLIHAPDTLIDDALRGELKVYFERVSESLESALKPLVHSLSVDLQQMSGLATSFSENIQMGVSTLKTFHDAVARLGGSADGVADQIEKVARISSDFVRELAVLQEKGARALADPANKLADSAIAINARMQLLDGRLDSLGEATKESAHTLREQTHAIQALQDNSASLAPMMADTLRSRLTPVLEGQAKVLRESQGQLTEFHRETLAHFASLSAPLKDLLTSLLEEPAREREKEQWIRDLRSELERLNLQIAGLSEALRTQPGTRDQRRASESEAELFRILQDIRRALLETTRSRVRVTSARQPSLSRTSEASRLETPRLPQAAPLSRWDRWRQAFVRWLTWP
jgi:hypothetical protein